MNLLSQKRFLLLPATTTFLTIPTTAQDLHHYQMYIENLKYEKTIFFYTSIFLAFLIFILAFYTQYSLIRVRKRNKQLKRQNKEIKDSYSNVRTEIRKLEKRNNMLLEVEQNLIQENKNLREKLKNTEFTDLNKIMF